MSNIEMASYSKVDICKLQKYIGSKEETTMRSWITSLLGGEKECFNLVLDSCNATLAVPYNNADVILRPYVAMKQSLVDRAAFPYCAKPGVLCLDQLFNTRIIKKISSNEMSLMDLNPNDPLACALLRLLDFLHDIEKHEKALHNIKGMSKSLMTPVLAEHLFSRLSPSHSYTVDDRCKHLPKNCPCGCKAQIIRGCTSIGSSATWHGSVDIFLNQNVAISVFEQDWEKDSCSKEIYEVSPSKGICKEDQNAKLDMCIDKQLDIYTEEENEKSRSAVLFQFSTISQIVAETITNSFAQVNMNQLLSGCLIPTFACTSETAYIYLYDSVNDILLQTCRPMDFMIPGGVINLAAVIKIWLYVNFPVFCVHNISQKCRVQKSNFHKICTSSNLKAYQKIECKKPIESSEMSIQGLIEPLILVAQRIPDM